MRVRQEQEGCEEMKEEGEESSKKAEEEREKMSEEGEEKREEGCEESDQEGQGQRVKILFALVLRCTVSLKCKSKR